MIHLEKKPMRSLILIMLFGAAVFEGQACAPGFQTVSSANLNSSTSVGDPTTDPIPTPSNPVSGTPAPVITPATPPPVVIAPGSPTALDPGGTPNRSYYVVTAGDVNALYRTYEPNDPEKAWKSPLATMQSQMLIDTLGLLGAGDANGGFGFAGAPTTTVSCHSMGSWNFNSGTGSEASVGPCDWVNDMTSADPTKWALGKMGQVLVNTINASSHKNNIVFLSIITGETDMNEYAQTGTGAGSLAGSPYSSATWANSTFRANQFKFGFQSLLHLVRAATGLPNLRMAVQVPTGTGTNGNQGASSDLIMQKVIDAANESSGEIILGNANPYQWAVPNAGLEGYRYYSGQSYMDLSLETGRAIAYAIGQSGLGDTKSGPCFGAFPQISSFAASGSSVLVNITNPNGASNLILPTSTPTQGWHVFTTNGTTVNYKVNSVTLAGPFQISLNLTSPIPSGATLDVTYGDHTSGSAYGSLYPALTRGGAVTDNSLALTCTETTALPRHNMPLALKLL